VGAKNPGTRESNAETSGYDWSKNTPLAEEAHGGNVDTIPSDSDTINDNVFGVKGAKDITKCWKHAIPSKPEPAPDTATTKSMNSFFGILGGEGLIKNGEIKNGVDGLELFGSKALVLGSGVKHNYETWQTSLSLTPDTISAKCFGNPKNPADKSNEISSLVMSELQMDLKVLKDTVISLQKDLIELKSKQIMLVAEKELTLKSASAEFTLQGGRVDLKGDNVNWAGKKLLLG
jgi:hypothetical protein